MPHLILWYFMIIITKHNYPGSQNIATATHAWNSKLLIKMWKVQQNLLQRTSCFKNINWCKLSPFLPYIFISLLEIFLIINVVSFCDSYFNWFGDTNGSSVSNCCQAFKLTLKHLHCLFRKIEKKNPEWIELKTSWLFTQKKIHVRQSIVWKTRH